MTFVGSDGGRTPQDKGPAALFLHTPQMGTASFGRPPLLVGNPLGEPGPDDLSILFRG